MNTLKETKSHIFHTRIKASTWTHMNELAAADGRSATNWLEAIVEQLHTQAQKAPRRRCPPHPEPETPNP